MLLQSRKVIFLIKKIASDNNYSESRELSISVFNNAISQYNFKKTLLPYQSIPEVTILNKDNLLLVYSQEGLVEFYRNSELLTKHLFYKSHQQNEQSILAKASINDVAILISEKAENKIFIFDFSGNLKDSVTVSTGIISGLAYSEDGKYLAASVYNWEKQIEINYQSFLTEKIILQLILMKILTTVLLVIVIHF
ncbi:MAG: hypothetical protein H6613_14190 [Ignavibacteriales bacterium]|nr:hypothetical protein [Ignavibacteriales bacterium]